MSIKKRYKNYTIETRIVSNKSTTPPTYGTPIIKKGFIQPVSGNESFQQGKAGENATHRLYTDVSVSANYGDRVTRSGQKYLVLYAIQPDGISATNGISKNAHKEIILGLFE